jgi:hypothetical protein
MLVVLQEQQVLAELGLGELIGGRLKMLRQLSDAAQVRLLSGLTESGQLEILVHALP